MPPIATDYIICPFTTVIDTREQAPFSVRGIKSDAKQGGKPLIIKTTVKTLTSGDYSIELASRTDWRAREKFTRPVPDSLPRPGQVRA